MLNRAKFYATVKAKTGKGLVQSQVDGIEAILNEIERRHLPLAHAAYVLATPWWETNKTMEPVREAYYVPGVDEAWRRRHFRYYPWYGRGLVQITWIGNYEWADQVAARAGLIKKGDILANPDLVMRLDISVFLLVEGMVTGAFTGKSLGRYLPTSGTATREEYMQARRIINGMDRADDIEDGAQIFERALRDGGYGS